MPSESLLSEAHPGGEHEHTLLLVLSDHGQTLGGDHGGSSPAETDTVLAAFSMGVWWRHRHPGGEAAAGRGSQQSTQAAAGAAVDGVGDADFRSGEAGVAAGVQSGPGAGVAEVWESGGPAAGAAAGAGARMKVAHTVAQLDLTATFAMLMGVPVPYSNIGGIDPHLWGVLAGPEARGHLTALMLTCKQVRHSTWKTGLRVVQLQRGQSAHWSTRAQTYLARYSYHMAVHTAVFIHCKLV